MLYFGIPVKIEEASRLFGRTFDRYETEIAKNMKMSLHCTDKSQYIIGYKIKINNSDNMKSVDQFISQLSLLKEDFKREILPYYEKFSTVEIYPMEEETEIVHFPEPYIIEWQW